VVSTSPQLSENSVAQTTTHTKLFLETQTNPGGFRAMSLLPEENKEECIGYNLYISFNGYAIRLREQHLIDTGPTYCDHWIDLKPNAYLAMLRWLANYPALWEHFSTREAK
jgi:hypothetical protein